MSRVDIRGEQILLRTVVVLTPTDEVRHADTQHRTAGDPSEGHTVKAGEREVNPLGIADGNVEGAVRVLIRARLRRQIVIVGFPIGDTGNDLAP